MTVSDRDRQRMASLGRELDALENDEEATGTTLDRAVAAANEARRAAGRPPLITDASPPEAEFYRRARALGLRRRRG